MLVLVYLNSDTILIGSLSEWVSEVTQSCPTLCNPTDCSLSGCSVHGIFQARVLEWIAISFSRGSSRPRNWTWVSRIAGRRFTIWTTRESLGTCDYVKLHGKRKLRAWTLRWENYLELLIRIQHNHMIPQKWKGQAENLVRYKTWEGHYFSVTELEDGRRGPWTKKCGGL